MTTKFKNTVDSGDMITVRLMIANELMLDPRGDCFHEMLDYASSKLPNLYEDYDGKDIGIADESAWDEKYLSRVKSELNYNFSKERLEYYEKVAKVVLKAKAEILEKTEPKKPKAPTQRQPQIPQPPLNEPDQNRNTNREKSNANTKNESTSSPNPAYVGIAAGSAAITALGFCIAPAAAKIVLASVLASVGVAGVIVGGCLIYKDLKK